MAGVITAIDSHSTTPQQILVSDARCLQLQGKTIALEIYS